MAPETIKVPKVPGYTFKGLLGKGANGVVYRAVQESMQRDVAIKFLSPRFAKTPGYIENFVKEARSAAKLSHPNIILGIDVGDVEGVYYFVMEYVEGKMLRDILKDRKRLPEAEALQICAQISRALDHAGRNGFVHRDVKPANIMVTPDGIAKLCDLGLAVSVKDEKGKPQRLAGTPYYMSPEQAKAEPNIDVRADIYSLGATLYHTLVGEPPFKGDTPEHVIARHLTDPPPSPREKVPEVTKRTADLVVQMMAKDRAKRPPSAGKLADEMVKCAEMSAKTVAMASRATVARRPVRAGPGAGPLVAVAAALLAVIGAGWFFFGRGGPPDTPPVVTPGGTSISPDAEAAAVEEFAALKARAEADTSFGQWDAILASPDEMRRKHGESWAQKAALEVVESYREQLDVKMKPEAERLETLADGMAAQDRLREALQAYDAFPKKFLTQCPSGRRVEQLQSDLRRRIEARMASDKGKVDKLIGSGDLPEAEALLAKMELYVLETKWIEDQRRTIKEDRNTRAGSVRREIDTQYIEMEGTFRKHMADRKFTEAIRAVGAFLEREWKTEARPLVRVDGFAYGDLDPAKPEEVVERCERFITEASPTPGMACILSIRNAAEVAVLVAEAEKAVPPMAQSMERITLATYGGGPGYYRMTGAGMVEYVEEGKGRHDLEPVKYDVADLDALAARNKPDPVRHMGRVGLAYFYSGRPDTFEKAAELLTQAADKGYRGARHFALNVAKAREADLAVEIKKLWATAQQCVKDRRWFEASDALDGIARHKDHPAAKALQPEIDKLRAVIQPNVGKIGDLEKEMFGKLVSAAAGKATLHYDFADPQQFQAFETVATVEGRWTWKKGGLESSETTSAMRWKRPIAGDVTVAFDLSAKECRNINTTLFYDPAAAEKKHYTVHLGLDVVSGKDDPTDTKERKYGLPRYTIVKYPLQGIPTGADRMWRRGFWDGWKKQMIGKAVAPGFEMPLNTKVRVTIERSGPTLRLKVDDKPVWEGSDGEYRQGSLLFYSESRVELSNLDITFSLGN